MPWQRGRRKGQVTSWLTSTDGALIVKRNVCVLLVYVHINALASKVASAPGLEYAFIAGSAAVGFGNPTSDIDLFIGGSPQTIAFVRDSLPSRIDLQRIDVELVDGPDPTGGRCPARGLVHINPAPRRLRTLALGVGPGADCALEIPNGRVSLHLDTAEG